LAQGISLGRQNSEGCKKISNDILVHGLAISNETVRQPESGWPGQVGLDRLVDQDPTFGFCLLVASLVPRSVVVG